MRSLRPLHGQFELAKTKKNLPWNCEKLLTTPAVFSF